MDEMNRGGDKHMGFDHLKTTHHFLLANDGGSIQFEANFHPSHLIPRTCKREEA
jgi:hypothetical protein